MRQRSRSSRWRNICAIANSSCSTCNGLRRTCNSSVVSKFLGAFTCASCEVRSIYRENFCKAVCQAVATGLWPVILGRVGSPLLAVGYSQNRRAHSDAPYLGRPIVGRGYSGIPLVLRKRESENHAAVNQRDCMSSATRTLSKLGKKTYSPEAFTGSQSAARFLANPCFIA